VRRSGRAAFARDGTEPVFSFFVVGGFCRRLLSFLFLADRPGLAGSPEIRASYSRLVSPSRGARSAGSPARAPLPDRARKAQAAKMPVIILRSLIAVRRTSVLSLLIGAVGFIAPGGGGRPVKAGALRQSIAFNPTSVFVARLLILDSLVEILDSLFVSFACSLISFLRRAQRVTVILLLLLT